MLTPRSPISTTQAARTADGTGVLGATIFVKTDCSNNARLPLDQQDPAYQHDGVAAPQSVYNDFITEIVPFVQEHRVELAMYSLEESHILLAICQ